MRADGTAVGGSVTVTVRNGTGGDSEPGSGDGEPAMSGGGATIVCVSDFTVTLCGMC